MKRLLAILRCIFGPSKRNREIDRNRDRRRRRNSLKLSWVATPGREVFGYFGKHNKRNRG